MTTPTAFRNQISSGLVVVDFWAPWCGPCKTFGPILEKFADENPSIRLVKVNVDEEGDLASDFRIRSIPTVILFKDGIEQVTIVGSLMEKALKAKLVPYLAS